MCWLPRLQLGLLAVTQITFDFASGSQMTKEAAFGQGIRRISAILQTLGRGPDSGLRLTDVALETDLNKATVHRLLNGLCQVGLVEPDPLTGRFHLGPEMFALGSAAAKRFGLNGIARPHLVRLEGKTNDTNYLSVRSGFESVCVDRCEGSYPIKVLTLNIGDRRPLGIGGGGLTLLSFMPDDEIELAIEANKERLAAFPTVDIPKLYSLVEASRQQGYAFFDGYVIPEMSSMGVPVMGPDGRVIAAIAIAAISSRLQRDRREVLLEMMNAEARALEASLLSLTLNGPVAPDDVVDHKPGIPTTAERRRRSDR